MKTFSHGDLLIIDGRKAYIGTVAGYAEQYKEDPIKAKDRAIAHHHELYWVTPAATVLASKEYYEAERVKWTDVPTVRVWEIIAIRDTFGVRNLRIEPAPNDNWKLR